MFISPQKPRYDIDYTYAILFYCGNISATDSYSDDIVTVTVR